MAPDERRKFVDWLITRMRELAYINPDLAAGADQIESNPKMRALLEAEAPAIRNFMSYAPDGAAFERRRTWTH